MKRFEVLSSHLSNALLSPDGQDVYKLLNVQVKVNFEAQQDLRSKGPSKEDYANDFADAMRELFLNHFVGLGPDPENTKKVNIETKQLEDQKQFGWYELYKHNSE